MTQSDLDVQYLKPKASTDKKCASASAKAAAKEETEKAWKDQDSESTSEDEELNFGPERLTTKREARQLAMMEEAISNGNYSDLSDAYLLDELYDNYDEAFDDEYGYDPYGLYDGYDEYDGFDTGFNEAMLDALYAKSQGEAFMPPDGGFSQPVKTKKSKAKKGKKKAGETKKGAAHSKT